VCQVCVSSVCVKCVCQVCVSSVCVKCVCPPSSPPLHPSSSPLVLAVACPAGRDLARRALESHRGQCVLNASDGEGRRRRRVCVCVCVCPWPWLWRASSRGCLRIPLVERSRSVSNAGERDKRFPVRVCVCVCVCVCGRNAGSVL